MSNQRNRKIHARKVNWGGSTSKVWGVKPDTRKAILWYKEAAEQGYAHAQYTLGLIYRNGSGINVNHYESQKMVKTGRQTTLQKMRKDYLPGFPHINVECHPNRWSIFPYQTSKDKKYRK